MDLCFIGQSVQAGEFAQTDRQTDATKRIISPALQRRDYLLMLTITYYLMKSVPKKESMKVCLARAQPSPPLVWQWKWSWNLFEHDLAHTVLKKRNFPPRNRQNNFFLSMSDNLFFHQEYTGTQKVWPFAIGGKFWPSSGAESFFFLSTVLFLICVKQ